MRASALVVETEPVPPKPGPSEGDAPRPGATAGASSAPHGPTAFTGWLVDARGEPLADHVLQLARVGGELTAPEPEATATSLADGRFAFEGVAPGSKLVSVRGPGEGDVPVLQRHSGAPGSARVAYTTDEGSLYLALAADGLRDVRVIGPRHARFWAHGLLELEGENGRVVREIPESRRVQGNLRVVLADPLTPRADPGADPPGLVLRLNGPPAVSWLGRAFLVGADGPTDTLLVVDFDGFHRASRPLTGTAVLEDAGILLLARRAHLDITIEDESGRRADGCTLVVTESGGGLPERQTRYELVAGFQHHECDRRDGRYEVQVTTPDGQAGLGTGELRIEPEPQQVLVSLAAQDG